MPRRASATLTDAELRIMEVLWRYGSGTVGGVVTAMPFPAPAYNSVLTILRILESKGYVRHRKDGRAFVYEPIVDREQARYGALKHLLSRFFDNSPEQLVLKVLEHEEIDRAELARLRALAAGKN